ncbi:MAG TPA: lysophospholipid acyltransferase family protein [Acidobacteriota bacterium]|nr:lysophospholipid acyltransferase family protein [Acidobacteriota bacterium]
MHARPKARNAVEYALARATVGFLGSLPRPVSIALGRSLGRIAYLAMAHLRRIGARNLVLALPQLNRSQRRKILQGCFDSLGRQLGEFCHFPHATPGSLRRIVEFDPESVASLEAARARGRGILFITAHLGAWELLVFAYSALDRPMSFLVRPIENPWIERWVHAVRSRFGNEPIDKKSAGLTCMRILRKGETLGILSDLNALPQEGIFVPFFGELACTTIGVAALALSTDATVFPVFAPWDPSRRRYVFRGGPALEMLQTGDHERDIAINTARVTAVIEKWVRRYPDQWMWIHERWHAYLRPGDRYCTDFPPV